MINLTLDLINDHLGKGSSVGVGGGEEEERPGTSAADDDLESAFNKPKKKSRWAEPAPILPIKPWQVGESCQAVYPADGQYYDATIEEINTDGEVSVKFRGYKERVVSSLGLLKLPSSGTTTVHATGSAKNKKELLQHQKELKKEKKKKHLENMKTLEEEREKEKTKWSNFSAKAFGKKGFVKKSIFKTPESSDGRVGVGTCGISGQKMTEYESAKKYRKGH